MNELTLRIHFTIDLKKKIPYLLFFFLAQNRIEQRYFLFVITIWSRLRKKKWNNQYCSWRRWRYFHPRTVYLKLAALPLVEIEDAKKLTFLVYGVYIKMYKVIALFHAWRRLRCKNTRFAASYAVNSTDKTQDHREQQEGNPGGKICFFLCIRGIIRRSEAIIHFLWQTTEAGEVRYYPTTSRISLFVIDVPDNNPQLQLVTVYH